MNPQRWREVEALFERCLALDAEQRATLLDGVEDRALAAEVASLLAHEPAHTGLQDAIARAGQDWLGETGALLAPGVCLGPWRLLRELGRGGMGVVWLAERADEAYRQQVAIKMLMTPHADGEWLQRFRAERQILANLDHPHIARLLDGGSSSDGRPYLVMEYVEGQPLTAYCDAHGLDLRARLGLFRQICTAVAHAHRQLVVHRDLKPANILVNAEQGPKLLDFGIARMLDPAVVGVDPTRPWQRLLTPNYASPEQLLGLPVGTTSDIYSLGVVLCELLTGLRPHRRDQLGPDAVAGVLGEISRGPSALLRRQADETTLQQAATQRGLAPRQLLRQLRGDLDTIVLKAIHVEPERRYRSAEDLADDVQRFLEGRPVAARPDSWRYRLGKLIQRHPLASAASVTAVLMALLFVGGIVLQSQRLAQERDRAVQAEAEARATAEFLTRLFELADPGQSRGETVTARELLDQGAARIGTELQQQPAVQAALMSTLAEVHRGLGLRERAAELHREALRVRQQHLGPNHALSLQSEDRLGDTLRSLSRFDEAETHLRRVLEMREAEAAAQPLQLADSLNNLGLLLFQTGADAEAEPLLRRALALRLAHLGDAVQPTQATRTNLGLVLDRTGRHEEGQLQLRTVFEQRRATLGDHPSTARAAQALGTALMRRARLAEAEALLREAIEIQRRVLPAGHPELVNSLSELAYLLHDQLKLSEAEALFREVLLLTGSAAPADAQTLEQAFTLNNFAVLLQDQARFDEARSLLQQSIELRARLLGPDNPGTRRAVSNLGRLLHHAGNYPLARSTLADLAGQLRREQPLPLALLVETLVKWAALERDAGQHALALELLQEALVHAEAADGAAARLLPGVLLELAQSEAAAGLAVRCRQSLQRLQQREQPAGAAAPARLPLAQASLDLAQAWCAASSGEIEQAQRQWQQIDARLAPSLPPEHYLRAQIMRLRSRHPPG